MSEAEQSLKDPLIDPSPEQVFPSYFTAFRFFNPESGVRYHPFVNFIFSPTPVPNEECFFDFLHEFAHAQLQNGVLGLTLQTLHKLPAKIEKSIFSCLWERMVSWRLGGRDQETLFKEMFVFGEPRSISGSQISSILLNSQIRELRDLLRSHAFRTRWHVFDLINERRKALHSRWKILHEGFATFLSIEIGCGEEEFSYETRERVAKSLFPAIKDETKRELFCKVGDIARLVRRRKLSVKTPHSSYTRGFQTIERLRELHRSTFVAMVAVLAASHFSYPSFPILDAPKEVFDSWLSGPLNPLNRLTYLSENPELLRPFADPDLTPEALPSLMIGLIRGFPDFSPVTSTTFGEWSVKHLWGSSLYARAFDEPPLTPARSVLQNYQESFAENRSEIFTHGEMFLPTLLLADGTVIQDDENVRRAFFSNFVDFYEIERTSRLLLTLSAACDVSLPEIWHG